MTSHQKSLSVYFAIAFWPYCEPPLCRFGGCASSCNGGAKEVRNNRSLVFQSIARRVRWRRKKSHSNFYIFREIRYTGFCPGETLYAVQSMQRIRVIPRIS